jgi:hypothetical protein
MMNILFSFRPGSATAKLGKTVRLNLFFNLAGLR